jgi:hypothetical protein
MSKTGSTSILSKIFITRSLICILLVLVLLLQPIGRFTPDANANPAVAKVIMVAKVILYKAVGWGLDKAGEYFLGSKWSDFKEIIMPVLNLFPKLLFDDSEESRVAVEEVIHALENDPRFGDIIEKHLEKIGAVTTDMWIRLDAVETLLEDHERRLRAIETALRDSVPIALEVTEPKYDSASFKHVLYEFIKHSGVNGFEELKGPCLRQSLSGCEKYEGKIMLPGARACNISTWEKDHKTPIATCWYFESNVRFYLAKPVAPDKFDPERPGKIDRSEITTPGKEEALLVFVEIVKKIDRHVPPHWKRTSPRHWGWLKDPKNWDQYQLRLKNELKNKEKRESRDRAWSSYERSRERIKNEANYYSASEPGSGRVVIVEYSRSPWSTDPDGLTQVYVKFR